jgi:integrase/recombinase XerC/integrase/recombinase XerD
MRKEQLTHSNFNTLTVQDALSEFRLHQRTSRHTPKTLQYYEFCLSRFATFLAQKKLDDMTQVEAGTIREFMLELEGKMKPNSVHAIMRAVRALFIFLEREELISRSPMVKVKMPKLDKTLMPAFTRAEIDALESATAGKEPTDIRNRALILMLLDSGLRLSECASLKVGDVDPHSGIMKVMGKGRKERVSKLGATSLKALTRYLRVRGGNPSDPLWLGRQGAMTAYGLAETLEKLGKRVGVHAHPHKFRRTCALFMLRGGADVFSVQYLLGHSDLAVLRRYLAQTEADVTKAHERYSPVDCLR